jgi:hypothetical protein
MNANGEAVIEDREAVIEYNGMEARWEILQEVTMVVVKKHAEEIRDCAFKNCL